MCRAINCRYLEQEQSEPHMQHSLRHRCVDTEMLSALMGLLRTRKKEISGDYTIRFQTYKHTHA